MKEREFLLYEAVRLVESKLGIKVKRGTVDQWAREGRFGIWKNTEWGHDRYVIDPDRLNAEGL